MSKTRLAVGIVFSLPPTSATAQVERFFERTVLPFLQSAASQDSLRFSLAFSGFLWDHLFQASERALYSEIVDILRQCRVSLLAGFYYEPLNTASLTREDFDFQLALASKAAERCSGVAPRSSVLRLESLCLAALQSVQAKELLAVVPSDNTSTQLEPVLQSTYGEGLYALSFPSLMLSSAGEERKAFDLLSLGPSVSDGQACGILIFAQHHALSLKEFPTALVAAANEHQLETRYLHEIAAAKQKFIDSSFIQQSKLTDVKPAPVVSLFDKRRATMLRELAPLIAAHETSGQFPSRRERLINARKHAAKACHHAFSSSSNSSGLGNLNIRTEAYDAVIRAQVDIDTLREPDCDPNIGWTRILEDEGSKDLIGIDTQLQRLYLCAQTAGSIVCWEYKPRKVNLANGRDFKIVTENIVEAEDTDFFENGPLVEQPVGSLYRRSQTASLSNVQIRSALPWSEGGTRTTSLTKLFTVRSGVGAHLPNATTGFSVEYWSDDRNSSATKNKLLVSTMLLTMPTTSPAALLLQPLLCVGGVLEDASSLDTPQLLAKDSVPGGPYGMRIVDSINDLTIDFRWSQQLSFCHVAAICDGQNPEDFQELKLSFATPLDSILNTNKPSSLFVSIA